MAVTGEKEVVGSKPERSSPVLCRGHPRLSQLKETQRLWGELNIEGGLRSPPCGPCPVVFSSNINHYQGTQVPCRLGSGRLPARRFDITRAQIPPDMADAGCPGVV